MIRSIYNLKYNPFIKDMSDSSIYETIDYKSAIDRLNYVTNLNGFALFTGNPGFGKTYTLNMFRKSLNPALYKVIYIPTSTITVLEFYKALAYGLGIEPTFKKIDLFRQIQDTIKTYVDSKKMKVIFIIDEAQYLKPAILHDLKLIFNFEMDSKNYATVILAGLPTLNSMLSRNIYEPLKQRIIMNYFFEGISKDEIVSYVNNATTKAGNSDSLFSDDALSAATAYSNGSIRKLNLLLEKALIIGASKEARIIDSEIIRLSQSEIEVF